jgi:pyridoxal phosphate enzyme (YggS family)
MTEKSVDIGSQLEKFWGELAPDNVVLVPVSKTKPDEDLMIAYEAGNRIFGENKVQELVDKHDRLPKDIEWHYIGHLQRNKVKYIAPFVHLIHAIDSERLLKEINKQAAKCDRQINCLLQVYIATEEAKFGFSPEELNQLITSDIWSDLNNIAVVGLMGMATNTSDEGQIRAEFKTLAALVNTLNSSSLPKQFALKELSIGMSGDYKIAIEEGSTMVRIGSAIFGQRN